MAKFLRMPSVSADADTAILSQWSVEAGANVLVAGSAVYGADDAEAAIASLRASAERAAGA